LQAKTCKQGRGADQWFPATIRPAAPVRDVFVLGSIAGLRPAKCALFDLTSSLD
jgi:hypothetical protein